MQCTGYAPAVKHGARGSDPDAVTAAVGRNLRRLRTRRAWTLDELAGRSGVSKGMLIQIEQSRTNPSLGTLCRVAEALDVSLARLVDLDEAPAVRVVTADQGVLLWRDGEASHGRLLVGTDRDAHIELWDWLLAPGVAHTSEAHAPGIEELLHVTEGVLTLEVDGTTHEVGPAGAVAFQADRPHAYRNAAAATPVRFTMTVVQPEAGPRAAAPGRAGREQGG